MSKFNERLLRTYIELVRHSSKPQLAALLVDAEVLVESENYDYLDEVFVGIPACYVHIVLNDNSILEHFRECMKLLLSGKYYNPDRIQFGTRFMEPEDNWQELVKSLIMRSKEPNQGVVTTIVRQREQKEPLKYNEMKFGSATEIRVAQELEKRKILFFPLPLAVRAETGKNFQDHREPDFLICHEGVWGILEVAFHPGRYEQDKQKDEWFKKSGILCVEHYTAEECFNNTASVIDKFLSILAQYKK
jgi:hypothetical protein